MILFHTDLEQTLQQNHKMEIKEAYDLGAFTMGFMMTQQHLIGHLNMVIMKL